MARTRRHLVAVILATLVLSVWARAPASAITAELAKKCRELALKAHPPQPGSKQPSSGKARQDFYLNCVARDGKVN
jgi:hypothetical protein